MYETFLSTVPLLSGLNTWEKAKIADQQRQEEMEAEAALLEMEGAETSEA